MNIKKLFIVVLVLFLPIILTGCFKKDAPVSQNKEGGFRYNNDYLGFSLDLPQEFQYFQTQKKQINDSNDLEIYVPTSDTAYVQEVPGYAKAVIVKVSPKKDFKDQPGFEKIGENKNNIFTIQFWNRAPKDWQDKWNDQMKNKILKSIKIN